ncbi:MAG: Gfo/Idh/MocA family oxidoreductase [Clostridia bacterium]|nr:Gfo/Idh/MocA family oxidoreductase [Clostridia bacterium]
MKQITVAIVGAGNRGQAYADYSLDCPSELKVIAVCDPNAVNLKEASDKYAVPDNMRFNDFNVFIKAGVKCDFVINATMDQMHYETAMALIAAGYNLLLEKPVTAVPKELLEIEKAAKEKGVDVFVCHVLRYTPFYRKIKEIIDSGEIGKIIDMEMNEHVWHGHFVNAYVRGKWRNEKECGSGFLLAKCCHDTDLMCWLNNITVPTKVSSFGSRAMYCPENAPNGSADYCYNCPVKSDCVFDAARFELIMDCCPQYTWLNMGKPISELTTEEKKEHLRKSEFGKCVYKTDMDIVDRQCVSVNFANGSVGTLNMVGGASKAGRHIHIVCEYGEIVGYVEENKMIYRKYNKGLSDQKYLNDDMTHQDTVIDIAADVVESAVLFGGHNGGDYAIMHDVVRYFNGDNSSPSLTPISDSVDGHFVVYAAEESRKNDKIIKLEEYKKSFNA